MTRQVNMDRSGRETIRASEEGRWDHVFAAIDLGTNNCRLLVARPMKSGFRVVDAFSRIVRLGQGVGADGVLSDEAMDRTISALKVCASKMRRRGVTLARNVATEACRKAENGAVFASKVAKETGLMLDIITPQEEARLAMTGCAPLLDADCENAIVFDIGGGSTELMWLSLDNPANPEILAWTSLPCGVVTLAEKFGGHNSDHSSYESMISYVTELLAPFEKKHQLSQRVARGGVQTLGTSGTVTTLACMLLALPKYDRSKVDGVWIEREEVSEISRNLAFMTHEQRVSQPCIGFGRADLVVAGCAILEAINRLWPCDRLRVADRGVREGLLTEMMQAADASRTEQFEFPVRSPLAQGAPLA